MQAFDIPTPNPLNLSSSNDVHSWMIEAAFQLPAEGFTIAELVAIVVARNKDEIMTRKPQASEAERVNATKNTIINYLSRSSAFKSLGQGRWTWTGEVRKRMTPRGISKRKYGSPQHGPDVGTPGVEHPIPELVPHAADLAMGHSPPTSNGQITLRGSHLSLTPLAPFRPAVFVDTSTTSSGSSLSDGLAWHNTVTPGRRISPGDLTGFVFDDGYLDARLGAVGVAPFTTASITEESHWQRHGNVGAGHPPSSFGARTF